MSLTVFTNQASMDASQLLPIIQIQMDHNAGASQLHQAERKELNFNRDRQ